MKANLLYLKNKLHPYYLKKIREQETDAIAVFVCIVLFILCILASAVFAETIDDEKLADAIYIAEGKDLARQPYGIETIECNTEQACRKICLNTIRNQKKRYEKSDKKLSFLESLARRYCPPNHKVGLKMSVFIIKKALKKDK